MLQNEIPLETLENLVFNAKQVLKLKGNHWNY